nr:hypothetical protein [uncultured Desulfuromonas sp.]
MLRVRQSLTYVGLFVLLFIFFIFVRAPLGLNSGTLNSIIGAAMALGLYYFVTKPYVSLSNKIQTTVLLSSYALSGVAYFVLFGTKG